MPSSTTHPIHDNARRFHSCHHDNCVSSFAGNGVHSRQQQPGNVPKKWRIEQRGTR
jgi:hypothetical protein